MGVTFVPRQPLVVDSFKNCDGLSRIAFLDGNTAVMLGKVVSVVKKSDMPPEEKKKKRELAPHGVAGCGAAADVPSAIEVTGQLQATRAGQYYYSERVARPMSPDTICDLGALWLAGGTTVPQTVRPEYYPWREPYSIGLVMH